MLGDREPSLVQTRLRDHFFQTRVLARLDRERFGPGRQRPPEPRGPSIEAFSTYRYGGKLLEEQDDDVLREDIRVLSQGLMETEVAGLIDAERHERTADRTAFRNGTRTRRWDTRMGTIELAIPKVRPGTYFSSLLHRRRRVEHALLAVAQEAYVHGVSTVKWMTSSEPSASRAFRNQKCRASAGTRYGGGRLSHAAHHGRAPLRVTRCHVPQSASTVASSARRRSSRSVCFRGNIVFIGAAIAPSRVSRLDRFER